MVEIADFKTMNREQLHELMDTLYPSNLLYLYLQLRNIRGHELEADMILPLYKIAPNVYYDSLDDHVKEALFVTFCDKINEISLHVEKCLIKPSESLASVASSSSSTTSGLLPTQTSTTSIVELLQPLSMSAVSASEFVPKGINSYQHSFTNF